MVIGVQVEAHDDVVGFLNIIHVDVLTLAPTSMVWLHRLTVKQSVKEEPCHLTKRPKREE